MEYFPKDEELFLNKKWQGWRLIMPTVSVGNVGQLSIDLLINNLKNTLLKGYLLSECVVPVAGGNPFKKGNGKNFTLSLDVYENVEHKLVILQQRAPLVKGKRKKFLDALMKWIESISFSELVTLTSVLACERIDNQLIGPQCRFLATDAFKNRQELEKNVLHLEKRKITMDTKRNSDIQTMDLNNDNDNNLNIINNKSSGYENEEEGIFMPGSGIAKNLYNECKYHKMPCLVLMRFSYEAENISDAQDLLSTANLIFHWLPIEQEEVKWMTPTSWDLMYGNKFDQTIFQ